MRYTRSKRVLSFLAPRAEEDPYEDYRELMVPF